MLVGATSLELAAAVGVTVTVLCTTTVVVTVDTPQPPSPAPAPLPEPLPELPDPVGETSEPDAPKPLLAAPLLVGTTVMVRVL